MKKTEQKGFSLVELLVAMTIGMFLAGAAYSVYYSSRGSFTTRAAVGNLQENIRYAAQRLTKEVRMAGYAGCAVLNANVNSTLDTTNTSVDQYDFNFGQGLYGHSWTGTGWSPALPTGLAGVTSAPLNGSDVLTIRSSGSENFGILASMPNTSADLKVDGTANGLINVGDVVTITDCQHADIFEVTHINESSGNANVVHNKGNAAPAPGNSTKSFSSAYGPGAKIFKLSSNIFYVAPSVVRPGVNSLWMRSNENTPEELALGIDGMDLAFGEDTDADGIPNKFVSAGSVTNFDNVKAVRVTLLVSTVEDNIALSPMNYTFKGTSVVPTDRKFHVVFTTTINLRNRTT